MLQTAKKIVRKDRAAKATPPEPYQPDPRVEFLASRVMKAARAAELIADAALGLAQRLYEIDRHRLRPIEEAAKRLSRDLDDLCGEVRS
jgi:hypothetical protein